MNAFLYNFISYIDSNSDIKRNIRVYCGEVLCSSPAFRIRKYIPGFGIGFYDNPKRITIQMNYATYNFVNLEKNVIYAFEVISGCPELYHTLDCSPKDVIRYIKTYIYKYINTYESYQALRILNRKDPGIAYNLAAIGDFVIMFQN